MTKESDDGSASSDSDQSSSSQEASLPSKHISAKSTNNESAVRSFITAPTSNIGSGLKRPLEVDTSGNPVIKKRQRFAPTVEPRLDDLASWDGFTSEGDTDDISMAEEGESDLETADDSDSTDTESSDSDSDSDESRPRTLFPFALHSTPTSKPHLEARANPEFKAWATHQMNIAQGFQPSNALPDISSQPHVPMPRKPPEPKGSEEVQKAPPGVTLAEIASNTELSEQPKKNTPRQNPILLNEDLSSRPRKIHNIVVQRSPAIQEARMKLPVVAEEQTIMEAIHKNPVTLISAATGSGKTTQVPQFLYEAGYGNPESPLTPGLIGVTQPRRVAAISTSARVGAELNRSEVSSYQIRFDTSMNRDTAIKFMTDGILIREIGVDFILKKYSAIVLDEVHERSVNTDILIGMLSRIVDLRGRLNSQDPRILPLKLIIMSATMAGSFLDNKQLFKSGIPSKVECEGRQYDVTVHFARQTRADYVEDAFRKIVKAHRQLPHGGILVFLTGQNEITYLMKKLKEKLSTHADIEGSTDRTKGLPNDSDSDFEYEDSQEDETEFVVQDEEAANAEALILPLYAQLPTKEQLKVFEPVPNNTRCIVLATNVSETSITIPGIRYVIDAGRRKEKVYDKVSSVQSFQTGWISKSSAEQRAGRAGRTGPGHCYRLYSSAVFERDFIKDTEPEILNTPLESVVLTLKSMDIQNVANFPWVTAPNRGAILKAERLLLNLGAIDQSGKISSLGEELSLYPLSPRLAKMLAIGNQHGCIYHVIALVAALAVPEVFIPESQLDFEAKEREDEIYNNSDRIQDSIRERRRRDYDSAHYHFGAPADKSDAIKLLVAFGEYLWTSSTSEDLEVYCNSKFLRSKALKEAKKLFEQLVNTVASNHPGTVDVQDSATLSPPSKEQIAMLKQIVAAGYVDNVAIRADLAPQPPEMPRRPKRAIDAPYLPLFPIHEGRAESLEELAVFIHPSSILARTSLKDLPDYIIYSTLQRSAPSTIASDKIPKTRMHPLTPVSGKVLFALAKGTPLLEYGRPLGQIVNVVGARDQRIAWVVPSLVGGVGREWPLPAVKVRQKRDERGRWNVERVEG